MILEHMPFYNFHRLFPYGVYFLTQCERDLVFDCHDIKKKKKKKEGNFIDKIGGGIC